MTRWTAVFILLSCASALAQASDLVYTKEPRFRIPYHSDPAELQRLAAREIQLFVSTDRGLSWRLAQSVPPTTGKFAYEAPGHGEYWVAVRTLDGQNRLHPAGTSMTAGLKVAVDSEPPALTLALDRTGNQVRLTWRASDPHLDPATLKLEFKQPGFDAWQPVHVIAQANGQTAWSAPASGTVAVRGSIADRAGNSHEAQADLRISETGYAPRPSNPELEGPIARQPVEATSKGVPLHIASDRSGGIPGQTAIGKGSLPAESPTGTATASTRKLVNTRAFNLGYEVEEVGPSGVGSVEFFITEDGGQKWFRYGTDPDLKSPFRIDVPGEGTYGFRVRVRSGVGLAAEPPRAGEPAAVVVVVDETPPVVTLGPPTQSTSPDSPTVSIRWKVEDENPATAKAIDLDYATSDKGPWTPIARGLDDQGGYEWAAESISAAKLFVRLTARDAAGNSGEAITAEPVVVDLTLPTARITEIDVQPIK